MDCSSRASHRNLSDILPIPDGSAPAAIQSDQNLVMLLIIQHHPSLVPLGGMSASLILNQDCCPHWDLFLSLGMLC